MVCGGRQIFYLHSCTGVLKCIIVCVHGGTQGGGFPFLKMRISPLPNSVQQTFYQDRDYINDGFLFRSSIILTSLKHGIIIFW